VAEDGQGPSVVVFSFPSASLPSLVSPCPASSSLCSQSCLHQQFESKRAHAFACARSCLRRLREEQTQAEGKRSVLQSLPPVPRLSRVWRGRRCTLDQPGKPGILYARCWRRSVSAQCLPDISRDRLAISRLCLLLSMRKNVGSMRKRMQAVIGNLLSV
jgi:hypothetical protein